MEWTLFYHVVRFKVKATLGWIMSLWNIRLSSQMAELRGNHWIEFDPFHEKKASMTFQLQI